MTKEKIKDIVTEIFKEVLDNDSLIILRETTADDIEEWDSLAHVGLIVAVEKEFKLKFDLIDLKPLRNVGDLLDLIQLKISCS